MTHKSYKRRKAFVPKCACCGPISFADYTRHHLVPKGHKDYAAFFAASRSGRKTTMPLCKTCHILVHETFGEGHVFKGPITRRHLTRWLQIMKAKREASRLVS